MNVLLITSKEEDYLQDSIIHGFKKLYEKNAVDYPVKSILYDDFVYLNRIRGNGFTLYGLLDKSFKSEPEETIERGIEANKFQLIVFTSIYRQHELFYKYFPLLKKTTAVIWIMDGEDSPVLFPYMRKQLKEFLFSPKPHKNFIYFKRELTFETLKSIYLHFPINMVGKNSFPKNIKQISFSIPREKIIRQSPPKKKLFTTHIVDAEVAAKVYSKTQPALFKTEKDYYEDIQESKFGITTKRAGWDCLRHYEIAANGAVICFKNLQLKPTSCAPHGLIDSYNCLSYSDYKDLKKKIENIAPDEYETLLQNSNEWIIGQSTVKRVQNLLKEFS